MPVTPIADLTAFAARHDTARHLAGPDVDETLVRQLLDPGRRA